MDNYFRDCPPMMSDGRLFSDYRSSQVREEIFRNQNCVYTENEARTLRIENGEQIMDREWDNMVASRYCHPSKKCFHKHPTTRVTSAYNNAEILAYNGELPVPACDTECHDYRLTVTKGSRSGRPDCVQHNPQDTFSGYPKDRCPPRCKRTNRIIPEALRQNGE